MMETDHVSRKDQSIMERFKMEQIERHRNGWRWLPEKVKRDAVSFDYDRLRRMTLHSLGVVTTRNAENLLVTGCIIPYGMTLQLLSFVRLLERLEIEYNVIREKEYCCGASWVMAAKPSEYDAALEYSRQAMLMNVTQCRELGAKKMFNFCYWCYALATRHFDTTGEIQQKYFLDMLVGRIEKESLKVKPTVIGYYEGCWARPRIVNPNLNLDLSIYRKWLDRIEGLRVVEMPHRTCCRLNPGRIFDAAEASKVDYIVTPCAGCFTQLDRAGRGRVSANDRVGRCKISLKLLSDLLLEALTSEGVVQGPAIF